MTNEELTIVIGVKVDDNKEILNRMSPTRIIDPEIREALITHGMVPLAVIVKRVKECASHG